VTGPPCAICCWNRGMTEPELPMTFPKRTAMNRVAPSLSAPWTIISATRFEAPMTLAGRTALSVDTKTKCAAPLCRAASTRFLVPRTLVLTASPGWSSCMGTCL